MLLKDDMKKKHKNKPLFYFWRSYAIFIVLFVIAQVPVFIKSFQVLEKQVKANTYHNVKEGMLLLDNEFFILNDVVLEMRSNRYFSIIRHMDDMRQPSDYSSLSNLQSDLKKSVRYLNIGENPLLFFQNGVIVMENMVYSISLQDSYQYFYNREYGSLKEWLAVLSEQDYSYALLPSTSYYSKNMGDFEGLAWIHSYKIPQKEEGALFLTVFPVEKLLELFGVSQLSEDVEICFLDQDTGGVLYANDIKQRNFWSQIEVESSNSNLTVQIGVPLSYYIGQLKNLIFLYIGYLVFFIFIAAIVSLILARKNLIPIKEIVNKLNKYTKNQKYEDISYEYIETAIMEIGDTAVQMSQQHEELNTRMVNRMLREHIMNGLTEEKLTDLKAKIQDFPTAFRLMLLSFTETEKKISLEEVSNLFKEQKKSIFFLTELRRNVYILIGFGNTEYFGLKAILEELLTEKPEFDCVASVSKVLTSMEELNETYYLISYNMKCFSEQKYIFADALIQNEEEQFDEQNLLENVNLTDMLLSGSEKDAVCLIQDQWEKIKKSGNKALLEPLFYMQMGILNNAAEKLNCGMALTDFLHDVSVREIEDRLICFSQELCEIALEKKQNYKSEDIKKLIEYMEEHFCDTDFCMTALSDASGMSTRTIARELKKNLNKTFSEYLDELRMQKAQELLLETSFTTAQIAKMCGYGLENTFFKAFKRKYGVSPSNYRETKVRDDNDDK